jgi:hypothetical protein
MMATKQPLALTIALEREGFRERCGSMFHKFMREDTGKESSLSSAMSWFINSTKFSIATT